MYVLALGLLSNVNSAVSDPTITCRASLLLWAWNVWSEELNLVRLGSTFSIYTVSGSIVVSSDNAY